MEPGVFKEVTKSCTNKDHYQSCGPLVRDCAKESAGERERRKEREGGRCTAGKHRPFTIFARLIGRAADRWRATPVRVKKAVCSSEPVRLQMIWVSRMEEPVLTFTAEALRGAVAAVFVEWHAAT